MHEPKPILPETIPAATALEQLSTANIYLFGHGTAALERAETASVDGLRTKYADLMDTAYELETVAESPDAAAHNLTLLHDWPHHGMRYVVIIGVERFKAADVPHRRYLQSIVQPRPTEDTYDETYGQPYVVPAKFVAGYFDTQEDKFTPNVAYDPSYDSGLLETTVNEDIQRERNPINALAAMGMLDSTPAQAERPPEPHSDDQEEDVW